MKKILIVTEHFAPNNEIAAVRITKFAKYFKLKGFHVGVVTRSLRSHEIIDPILTGDLKYIDEYVVIVLKSILTQKISYVSKKAGGVEGNSSENGIVTDLINKLLSLLIAYYIKVKFAGSLDFYLKKLFIKKAKKHVKLLSKTYDVILTSCGAFSVNVLGISAKRSNPNIKWIADILDPLINNFQNKKHLPYYRWILKMIMENADVITGVSEGNIEEFKDGFKGKKVVINDGFDEDDLNGIYFEKSEKFVLTYAGRLYSGMRDLSVVFKAISELIREEKINSNSIEIHYLGNEILCFASQVGYDLKEISFACGQVDRELSLQQQLCSHVLLLASWNFTGYTGVITGKFYEYMMINRPIICTVTGNLPDSQLKQMITAANNGVVWEQANDETDYPVLKDYLLKQYQRYEAGLPLDFSPDREYIEQFKFDTLANKFIELFNC